MKAYKCDICEIAITDPYTSKMKEFYWACDYENDGIYPAKAKRKQKLHLCGNCFEGLKSVFAKRSADPVPKEKNYAGCGQLCPHNTLCGCKVRENNGVCPLTNVSELSGKTGQLKNALSDVVPVVRCKDCNHLTEDGFCFKNINGVGGYTKPGPDDFCSYGERKK